MAKTIAIVPVRHFSQRVPGKNYRPLGSKPLYYYVLETLLKSNVNKVIVDTDSEIIKQGINNFWGNNPRIMVISRPPELASPEISMNRIIQSILSRIWDEIEDDTIILQTHVTNPFLKIETVNQAIEEFERVKPDTLLTVNSFQKRIWSDYGDPVNHDPSKLLQTQDLRELYEENSCLYLFTSSTFKKYGNRLGEKRHFFKMGHLESWDIDTEENFEMAQIILKKFQSESNDLVNEQTESSRPNNINEELFDYLNKELKEDIDTFLLKNNARYRILISAPYMMSNIETFRQFYESLGLTVVVADVEERLSVEDLLNYKGQYDVAVCGDDAFSRNTLETSGVRAICKWGTGIDSIDQLVAKELNIPVYNTPDAFSVPVAQSILSAILNFTRQTYSSTDLMRNTNEWVKLQGKTLEELTIGVIGLGNVGRTTCEYLTTFKAKILGYDCAPVPDIDGVIKTSLDELLEQSDIVCTCCTLEHSSYHIIDSQSVKKMKKGSYLVNMARGKLVEEVALVDALNSGHLAGAALDVFEVEPLPETSALRKMSNVLLSSHNANSSPKYWNKVHVNTIRNSLRAILNFK